MNMETFRKFEEQFCMSCTHELNRDCSIVADYFLGSVLGIGDDLPPEWVWEGDCIRCDKYKGWS